MQGPLPFGKPHLPSIPHTSEVHCAGKAQDVPRAAEQVEVVALHWPDTQTAAALGLLQVPVCSASFGTGAPAGSLGVHAPSLQKPPAPEQSASTLQLAAASHVLPAPQLPD